MPHDQKTPDLFEMLNNSAAPIQDADALSTMPLAEVPQGDVFASEAEKAALLRQEPYTRKGTMPERLVTRQQFIEDFLTRGFNERREERRGVNQVTRFTNPANGKYYVLTRRFEREYADRRYAVLFPEAKKAEQLKAAQPKPPADAGERKAAPPAPAPQTAPVEPTPATPVASPATPEREPAVEPTKAVKPVVPVELKPEERDFSYTPADDYTPRGAKTRIRANLDAIKLLKEIEAAGRLATPEEKKALARYTGWGAYKSVFDSEKAESIEEFARQKEEMAKRYGAHSYYATMELPSHLANWKAEFGGFYDQLKKTLTDEEWRLAAQSVLNAHYTDEPICHRLWSIARHVGFEGGSVGEFGCGTGKVVAAMPADLRAKSTVLGVEKDSITARISKLLFPQARIEEGALQDVPVRPNSLDLVIGNVPFSDVYPSGQKGKVKFNLHNYFIARSLDALRPGGLAVLITSSSTLQNNDEQRNALADRAELMGAIRLPNDAFADNANTEVVTDILIVRKPTPERRVPSEVFRQVLMTEVAEGQGIARFDGAPLNKTTLVNEYFLRHPEMVLGLHSLRGKMYGAAARAGTDDDDGAGQYTVVSTPKMKPLSERLDAAVAALPARVPNSSQERAARNPLLEDEEAVAETLTAATTDKVGGLVAVDGRLYQVSSDRELVSPDWHKADFKLPRGIANASDGDELALSWMKVRDALRQVIKTDLNPHATDNDSDRCRATLRKAYGEFVEEHGRIGESKALRALLRYEPEFGNTEALEIVREVKGEGGKRQRLIEPAAILTTRTLRPAVAPAKAETVMDAVLISVGQHGRIDIPYICSLTGKEDEEGVKRLLAVEGVGYENPETGEMELRQHYLTGNVRRKLEQAEEAARADARFTLNVEALRAVQPARVPFDNIRIPLGSSWVPSELVRDFAAETFGQGSDFHLNYFQRGSTWLVSEFAWSNRLAQWSAKATQRVVPPSEIFQAVLDQQPIRITYTVGTKDEKKIIFDEQGTANSNERAEAMRQAWLKWVGGRADARQMIEDAYNDTFNNVVAPDPDGRALTFPGIATGPGALVPRPHQRNGVMRVLSEQAGVIAYGVGFGKTLVGILGAYEMKRTGAAQKPMILCDNANYAQFVETARNVYPSARILHSTDDDMKAENRERFKNRVATGDWDLVLMQRSHFERVPVSHETEVKWLQAELADLRAVKSAADENAKGSKNRTASGFARRMAKALERAEERLKEKLERMKERSDEGLTWEQLGVDFLVVDESHREKKIGFATKFDVKGIDPNASGRGRGLLMKARHIQDRRGGRGVVGMTGTPCTNTMAEYWSALKLFHPRVCEDFGVERFDDFKTAFCMTEDALELNESNGRWRIVNRLSKFINGPAFIQFIRTGMDVKMDSAEVKLNVPKLVGGKIELCAVPLTDATFDKMDRLSKLYESYEKAQNKKELSWVPIVLMQCGLAASIDPRLVDAGAQDEAGSLARKLVENVATIYHQTRDRQATQCVFLDRYRTMDTSILRKVEKDGLGGVQIELEDADSLPGLDESESEDGEVRTPAPEPEMSEGEFNLYRALRKQLVAAGIPENQIAIVHEAKDAQARRALFGRVDSGEVAVILGSSDKMGIGANYQRKLYAAHHFDPCRNMTPDQMEQRNGRILRDGNTNPEVRVIYYGMEDTVTPAIWHRLQRKTAFIKQGLAAKGVGVEFEDTGEIRLEEMKAALITDKRQMRRAELIAEIKEQKVQREVVFNRGQSLRENLSAIESDIRVCGRNLPKAQERAAAYASHVAPPFSRPAECAAVVEALNLRAPEQSTEKEREVIEKCTKMLQETKGVFVGDSKAVTKQLDALVQAWKILPLSQSQMKRELGTVTVNGLPLSLVKEQIRLITTDEDAICLVAYVGKPGQNGEWLPDTDVKPARFGSGEALLKLTQATAEQAALEPTGLTQRLGVLQQEREEAAKLVDSVQPFDESRLTQLQADLVALEKDMREKPFQRGGDRFANRSSAAASQPAAAPLPIAATKGGGRTGR